jgi:hypothetical protein
MTDADRFRLLGTYRTPRVRVGRVLACEARDCDVIVTGYSSARVPWPVGYVRGRGGPSTLILFGDLAAAVRRESNQAVGFWFGVCPATVSHWRRKLDVRSNTAGTHELRRGYAREDWFAAMQAKARATPVSAERRKAIGDRCRGKKRPRHVVEAVRKGRAGKPQSEEARAKMRAAWAARGPGYHSRLRPWTQAEDELVRTLPAAQAAARTGRTLSSVYTRRTALGVPDGRATNGGRR